MHAGVTEPHIYHAVVTFDFVAVYLAKAHVFRQFIVDLAGYGAGLAADTVFLSEDESELMFIFHEDLLQTLASATRVEW